MRLRNSLKTDWIGGGWVSSDAHQTMANAFRELGRAESYDRVVFVIEDIKMDEQQQKGAEK